MKEVSELLGKETIDLYNTSETRGSTLSKGLQYQKTGKNLITEDEIATMDGSKCILQVRGVRPFLSDEFDIRSHGQYFELEESDDANSFDITARKSNPEFHPDESYIVYSVEVKILFK